MINFKEITKAIEDIIVTQTTGYIVERNVADNDDVDKASRKKGWIGISRVSRSFEHQRIGNSPWLDMPVIVLNLQVVSLTSASAAEKLLGDAEDEILSIFLNRNNLTLNNTVDTIESVDVEYITKRSEEEGENFYFISAIISLVAKTRA